MGICCASLFNRLPKRTDLTPVGALRISKQAFHVRFEARAVASSEPLQLVPARPVAVPGRATPHVDYEERRASLTPSLDQNDDLLADWVGSIPPSPTAVRLSPATPQPPTTPFALSPRLCSPDSSHLDSHPRHGKYGALLDVPSTSDSTGIRALL